MEPWKVLPTVPGRLAKMNPWIWRRPSPTEVGKVSNSFLLTYWPISALLSSSGGSLETVICSVTAPTSSWKSRVRVWATDKITLSRKAVLKPAAEADKR